MTTKTDQIRGLNDELRQHLLGGIAVITPGVAALGQEAVERIVKTVAVYDDFCHANDPHEEHDFGSFEADGQKIFFQNRLFRQDPHLPLPRSIRPFGHRARDHDHAGRRVLRYAVANCQAGTRFQVRVLTDDATSFNSRPSRLPPPEEAFC
jgi:hypothetical protein